MPAPAELSSAWIEGDPSARWRTSTGHGPGTGARSSGSSFLEVPRGCRLPRHTDSAEETIVITGGSAEVTLGEDRCSVDAGQIAIVPADLPHEVRNAGDEPLRFVAVYAAPEVVTTYEQPVQPEGKKERKPVA